MKYINQTLYELEFDPSSDIKLCQYDSSLFEHWFMIKKRLKVQDRVEKSIKLLLDDLWKGDAQGIEVVDDSRQGNLKSVQSTNSINNNIQNPLSSHSSSSNSDDFERKKKSSGDMTLTISSYTCRFTD